MTLFAPGIFAGLSLLAGRLFSGDAKRRRQTRKAKRKTKKATRQAKRSAVTVSAAQAKVSAGVKFDVMEWLKKNWFIPAGVVGLGVLSFVLLGGKKKKVGRSYKRRSKASNPSPGSSPSRASKKVRRSTGRRASSPAMKTQQNKMKRAGIAWRKAGKPGSWKNWVKKYL